jgi:hypothetical protein
MFTRHIALGTEKHRINHANQSERVKMISIVAHKSQVRMLFSWAGRTGDSDILVGELRLD